MLTESLFVICGEGYNGVANTLDEAHAIALRMEGGTVYVKVDLVEHILEKMDRVVAQAERIASLTAEVAAWRERAAALEEVAEAVRVFMAARIEFGAGKRLSAHQEWLALERAIAALPPPSAGQSPDTAADGEEG